ncbi:MAG: hypothetical protein ACRD3C_08970 [Vicinamibacterales bacterium]
MDQNQERRRGHFHRGRRNPDRRGVDRRVPPQPQSGRDQVDVEQIMRDIRARIAQRQGIELSNQQIQDLAARRLESILDPRAIRPSLLEGLRRSAGAVTPTVAPKASSEPVYTFEDSTIYDSHRAMLRFMRRLLGPLLKLFFNPNPLIRALHLQARLNVEAAEREEERERRQAEWNALHYEILQRLVTDVSRVSLEVQALSMRVESLNARVDFNDRRARAVEGAHTGRAGSRPVEAPATPAAVEPSGAPEGVEAPGVEGGRRRRRRRRGRRGGVPQAEPAPAMSSASVQIPVEQALESETAQVEPSAPAPLQLPAADEHISPQVPSSEIVEQADTDRPDQ